MNPKPQLPTGRQLLRSLVVLNSWMSLPALLIVVGSLLALLRLTTEQWRWFATLTLLYAAFSTPFTQYCQRRMLRPLLRWLDEGVSPREAFSALMVLPFRAGLLGAFSWVFPVVLISTGMALRFPDWGWMETFELLVSASAAGFVVGSLLGYMIKDRTSALREALAAEIGDPKERAALVRPMSLRTKLLSTICLVALVPVCFAALLAESRTERSVEQFAVQWQRDVLAALPAEADAGDVADLSRRLALAPTPVALRLETLDALERDGALSADLIDHVRSRIVSGGDQGDSAALPSDDAFSWRVLRDGSVLMAVSPGAALRTGSMRSFVVIIALIAFSVLLAFAVAYHTAHDVSHATEILRGEAERLAGGDLRRGRIWESEDELGELARSFESMGESLRRTVSQVAEAAERVESSAGQLAPVSSGVASVTAEQVEAMERAAAAMEQIDAQVRGIASSSSALNESVEESSSSILELGASGEELNETAVRLHESVEGVSSSIEQLVRSVKEVLSNAESLSDAAEETSASMEEMASSLREVDTSAEETSRLSTLVVERAEGGRAKVQETIEGMEEIQTATETAERVIRGLHGRTVEIGAIVDVIDDVADETNLLALNAAIIAAQAGEHGRAFSVVADEIKDLAERVLASTKEIGSLISAVQEESSKATTAIEGGTSSVASGVERSAEAGMALEAITRASRESGERMTAIVQAVQAQAKAAGHVVELMERVRGGVEQIRRATVEQDSGHAVVSRSSVTMRDVAQQVRGTTEEQARGSGRIRESIEEIREAVERINGALQEQSQACASALEGLEAVQTRTRANDQATRTLDEVSRALLAHAGSLREEVERFRV